MPLNRYFSGRGEKVMSEMTSKYGDKKGKSVFYATINKMKKREVSSRKMGGK